MSQRIEWMGVDMTGVRIADCGEEIGTDFVDGEHALVISCDEAVVIEGDYAALELFLEDALTLLRERRASAG